MMMWHIMPCHINLGPHISMSQFLIKKLFSATCDYSKRLKNISLKTS